MIREPPIRDAKDVNLTKGKIMIKSQKVLSGYDGTKATVGDVVYDESGLEGSVAYVGTGEFVVDWGKTLHIFPKVVMNLLRQWKTYIKVNGFLVPAPAEEFTEGVAYAADPSHPEFNYTFQLGWPLTASVKRLFARGLAHRTAANAIAHAKAMLGIDPYARESLDEAWDERPAPPAGEDLPEPGRDAVPLTPPEASSL